jgi:hypothetical protein
VNCVCIDIGSHDIYFDVIAEQVVNDCEEEAFLCELAEQSLAIAKQSDDPAEKAFATEAARRLRELAEWFKENQP